MFLFFLLFIYFICNFELILKKYYFIGLITILIFLVFMIHEIDYSILNLNNFDLL